MKNLKHRLQEAVKCVRSGVEAEKNAVKQYEEQGLGEDTPIVSFRKGIVYGCEKVIELLETILILGK